MLISPLPQNRIGVRVRAAHQFAAAAASRLSMQSSGKWHEEQGQGHRQEKEQEQEHDDLGQGDVMPGPFEPGHQQPSLAWNKSLDCFLTLFRVKYSYHALKFHVETINDEG